MSIFTDGLQHAWSMFTNDTNKPSLVETQTQYQLTTEPRALNPNNAIPSRSYARSSISSMIFNRIAMDASMVKFQHVKLAADMQNQEVQYNSALQRLFEVEMNTDQSSTDFFHDLVYSLFDEGVVVAVPLEATVDPMHSDSYDIKSMRVGKVIEWFPTKVRVKVYNENKEISPKLLSLNECVLSLRTH